MNNFFYLIFLTTLFLFPKNILAQQGEIMYKTTMRKDAVKQPMSDFFKKIEKEINVMQFSLRYDGNGSYFENIKYVPFDLLSARMGLVMVSLEANWHQDGVKKESYFNRKIRNKTYLVKYDKMLNWTLTNETKKIENYTCFKATIIQKNLETGVEFIREAWYTTEIPVPYGPVGFGGLPGLILELKTGKAIFTAKKIVLNPKKGIKPYPKANMENPIGRKELPKLMRAARKVTED